jgi:glucosylceramidase
MQAKAITTNYHDGEISQKAVPCEISADNGTQERDVVNVYTDLTNQTICGFGGAITESVGHTLSQMPGLQQKRILEACFGEDGLRYTQVRTSIDSCDFAVRQYEAAHTPDAAFDLRHDETFVIPYIQAAQAVCPAKIGVMLTPWSPPAYMKDNGARSNGGRLKRAHYADWADYICRYILSYRSHGLEVSKLSVQNEPNARQPWDSCLFSGAEENVFLRGYLHPALIKNGLENLSVYIWDHNKERLFDRVRDVIDGTTAQMVSGAAFHWYSGDHFDALRLVRTRYPQLQLLFSEGCIEYSCCPREDQLQNARKYAHDMIGNYNAGMNTFFDWNIALDEVGGPNHAGNFCEAPIMCDTKTGLFEKRLSYYYIWHFSHFIAFGAKQVSSTVFSGEIDAAAFRNPDDSIAVVLSNNTPLPRTVHLRMDGKIIKVPLGADCIASVEVHK